MASRPCHCSADTAASLGQRHFPVRPYISSWPRPFSQIILRQSSSAASANFKPAIVLFRFLIEVFLFEVATNMGKVDLKILNRTFNYFF